MASNGFLTRTIPLSKEQPINKELSMVIYDLEYDTVQETPHIAERPNIAEIA